MQSWWGVVVLCAVAACSSTPAPQLVDVLDATAAECASGGVVIHTGRDDNANGVLDADEVESSESVCANTTTVRTSANAVVEPPGPNCAAGGTAVQTGVDADHNGVLEGAEIENVVYVCADQIDPRTVIGVHDASAAQCPAGGSVVESGLDLSSDGTLDANEVTSTSVLCSGAFPTDGIFAGDFHLQNAFDEALLRHFTQITGALVIEPEPGLLAIEAPTVDIIAGEVRISRAFDSLSMPQLVTAGSIRVLNSADVATLAFPALPSTYGITVEHPVRLSALHAPLLASLHELAIDANTLSTLELPILATVATDATIARTALTSLDLSNLTSVGGRLSISSAPLLSAIDLPTLTNVNSLALNDLPLLSQAGLTIAPLVDIPGGLGLTNLPWTNVTSFESLAHVGDLAVVLPTLTSLTGFGALTAADTITIGGTTSLASIAGFPHVATLSRLRIESNAALQSITGFPELAQLQRFEFYLNGTVELQGLQALRGCTVLDVYGNTKLATVDAFHALDSADRIFVSQNPELVTFRGFEQLASLSSFQATDNAKLASVRFPALTSVSSLNLLDYTLTTIAFPALSSATQIQIRGRLADMAGLAALRTGTVWIEEDQLLSFSLPLWETGGLYIRGANAMTAIHVPYWTSGSLFVEDAAALSTFEAPLLEELTNLWINHADSLREVRLPALQRTNGLVLQSMALLHLVDLPSLAAITPQGLVSVLAPQLGRCQVTDILDRVAYQGTPLLNAPSCETIERCHLQAPLAASVPAGTVVDARGRVRVIGLTDQSPGVDPSAVVRHEIGYGARASDPQVTTWAWSTSTATPGWNDASGFDEYGGSVTPPIGSYDVAARFSGDGGRTWTYCDTDGSQNGYQVANAGHLDVQ